MRGIGCVEDGKLSERFRLNSFNSSVTYCAAGQEEGQRVTRERGLQFPPALPIPDWAIQVETSQSVLFLDPLEKVPAVVGNKKGGKDLLAAPQA
jgi:hypothetical protein